MQIHDESVHVDIWKKEIVGSTGHRVPVYFLDTNHPSNSQAMIDLTGHLYGGDDRNRICQELLLGVGGVLTFEAMEHEITGMHLNEGHCTFALLEKAKSWGREKVRKKTLFTTHTPVPAGHDRFEWSLVEELLGTLLPADAKQMVKDAGDEEDGKRCSMSHLGIALSGQVNAVSSLNAEVASGMFSQTHINPITNGVHHITWTSEPFQALFDQSEPGWRQNPLLLEKSQFSDEQLLQAKESARMKLHQHILKQTGVTFEAHRLTIGFARRFATYKRANLVFSDLERLRSLGAGNIQFVFAGKAHPRDEGGKQLIRDIFEGAAQVADEIPVAFLEDYSMDTGLAMTSGVDIWLNNAGMALLVTHIAAATASLTWMFIEWKRFGRPSLVGIVTGMVAGLATVTPASGFIGVPGGLILGLVGGVGCYLAVGLIRVKLQIDDSLDVFAVHGVGGILGSLGVSFLALPTFGGLGLGEGVSAGAQFMVQLKSVVITVIWTAIASAIILAIVRMFGGLRVDAEVEVDGLDLSEHGERGYHTS